MRARLKALERAYVRERTEIALTHILEKLKHKWEHAASDGGPAPNSFDLIDALRDARIAAIPAVPYALRYVDRHAGDDGGPDCAEIFKMLLRGTPVPDVLERPEPAGAQGFTPGRSQPPGSSS